MKACTSDGPLAALKINFPSCANLWDGPRKCRKRGTSAPVSIRRTDKSRWPQPTATPAFGGGRDNDPESVFHDVSVLWLHRENDRDVSAADLYALHPSGA